MGVWDGGICDYAPVERLRYGSHRAEGEPEREREREGVPLSSRNGFGKGRVTFTYPARVQEHRH